MNKIQLVFALPLRKSSTMKHLPFLETERLILRPIALDDAVEFFEMDSQPEVHTYLQEAPLESIDEAINLINNLHLQYNKFGIGRIAIIDKSTYEFIGWTGFKYIPAGEAINNQQDYLDFGYRLRKQSWGKGYATEAALACMNFFHEKLADFKINAITHIDNQVSKHILEKVGFEVKETFNLSPSNVQCYWYELK